MDRLSAGGNLVRAVVRPGAVLPPRAFEIKEVGRLDDQEALRRAFGGIDVVIHLAARTHVLDERGDAASALAAYRTVNLLGTRSVAEAAVSAGVQRVVFASSIKVNGERTFGRPYMAADQPAPRDGYGITKWEAEQALSQIASRAGMEWVVIRPPLVYGRGAKGNFARLRDAVRRGIPLPLGALNNRRSFVALDNLVDLLALCSVHPNAAGGTFLVSDGEDLSTPELVRRIARAMETRAWLLPIPPHLLAALGRVFGRRAEVSRILHSLQVDIEPTCSRLGWAPPVTVDEGIRMAVADV